MCTTPYSVHHFHTLHHSLLCTSSYSVPLPTLCQFLLCTTPHSATTPYTAPLPIMHHSLLYTTPYSAPPPTLLPLPTLCHFSTLHHSLLCTTPYSAPLPTLFVILLLMSFFCISIWLHCGITDWPGQDGGMVAAIKDPLVIEPVDLGKPSQKKGSIFVDIVW